MKILFVPVGIKTFDIDFAKEQYLLSVKMLKEIYPEIVYPENVLFSPEELVSFLEEENKPDMVIFQCTTFASSTFSEEIVRRTDCPVIIWTLCEPQVSGGRMKLNSLTGAFSAGNTLYMTSSEKFRFVYGNPDKNETKSQLMAYINAVKVKNSLNNLVVASIGHTPPGFGFGGACDAELLRAFGIKQIALEARELFEKAHNTDESEYRSSFESACSKISGLDKASNKTDYAKLLYAFESVVRENNIGAVASRCWPDFFNDYKTAVCGVLSVLNDNMIAAACEGDMYGAISMYICMHLTGSPAFFGDPVSINSEENTITYWHCGMAACSLSKDKCSAGVHCNRKIGPTLELACKGAEKVTVFRIGKKRDGSFRFYIMNGSVPEKPQQYLGCSMIVKPDGDISSLVESSVRDGWEPHFAVAYGDITKELTFLAEMTGCEICNYNK